MKFLDTYESWDKVFKLVRTEDHYILWIHGNNTYQKVQLQQHELREFGNFILNFDQSEKLDNPYQ